MNTPRGNTEDAARLFDGERLTLARQLAGLRKNALAEKIGKTPTAVASYENGTKRPAPATVAQLAIALSVEPTFFLRGRSSSEGAIGTPHFRSLRSTTQINRDQARAYAAMAAQMCASLERHVEFPIVDVPSVPVMLDDWQDDEPERAARQVRAKWGLERGPIKHVLRLLENKGVLCVFSTPHVAAIDAYSLNSSTRPLILLNAVKRDYYRQRYDLAHELGHLVMHSDAEPGNRIAEEQANRFAAEFLMPADDIASLLPDRPIWSHYQDLKEDWGISIQALLFRARRLRRMPERTYTNAMTYLSAKGWRRQEPGRVLLVEQPSLLPQAAALLNGTGVTEQDLARECGVPLTVFRQAIAQTPHVIDEIQESAKGKSDLTSVSQTADRNVASRSVD